MPIKVANNTILGLDTNNPIGSVYVGSTQVYGGTPPPPPPIPFSGLVAWFEADDYATGSAVWVDKSGNNLNLTLSGTYSKDTGAAMSGSSVFLSAGWGTTPETALITGSTGTEYTYIEIVKPTVLGADKASFSIGGEISNYWFGGNGRMYAAWANNLGGVYLSTQNYATTKTTFAARRVSYGFTTTSNMILNLADSDSLSLTKYTSFTNALGAPPYNWAAITGTSRKFGLGNANLSGGFRIPGYYAVSILYNRILTDAEVTQIYDYYKTTYVLA